MPRTIASLAILATLIACSPPPAETPAYGRLTQSAREWVEQERTKDRDICRASHRAGSEPYQTCLDRRSQERREHLRALQDWYRARRLESEDTCVDPFTGTTAACREI